MKLSNLRFQTQEFKSYKVKGLDLKKTKIKAYKSSLIKNKIKERKTTTPK
jgi:hypothetical protein